MITETFAIIRIASQLGEQMLMAPTSIVMSGRVRRETGRR
jgi:hypothetical protein